MRIRTAALPIAAACIAGAAGPSSAQSLSNLFEATGNYQNPGARSLGLGGAFAALADDASAAELNPAGLTQLTKPEAGAEFRRIDNVTEAKYAGAFRSGAYGCFVEDLGQGPCDATFSDRQNILSYVSLVVPVGSGSTIAIYRHVLAHERLHAVLPVLDFGGGPFESTGFIADLDRRLVRTGISFARKIVEPLSVGVSLHVDSNSQTFRGTTYDTDYQIGGPLGGDPTILDKIEDSTVNQDKLGATLGVYWRPSEALSFGASYTTKIVYDEPGTTRQCPYDANGVATCAFGATYADLMTSFDTNKTFTLPYRWAVSAAWRPTNWLVVAGEADRVGYSDNKIAFEQCALDSSDQTCLTDAENNPIINGFDHIAPKNVWELHAGAEAVFPFAGTGLAGVRAGYWHDPDHSFQYRGCTSIPNSAGQPCVTSTLYPVFFPPLGSRDHFAGGVGVAWDWGQFDVGYDWVRQTHASTLAASVVIRMK